MTVASLAASAPSLLMPRAAGGATDRDKTRQPLREFNFRFTPATSDSHYQPLQHRLDQHRLDQHRLDQHRLDQHRLEPGQFPLHGGPKRPRSPCAAAAPIERLASNSSGKSSVGGSSASSVGRRSREEILARFRAKRKRRKFNQKRYTNMARPQPKGAQAFRNRHRVSQTHAKSAETIISQSDWAMVVEALASDDWC